MGQSIRLDGGVIDLWKRDLLSAREGEIIRIVSGEVPLQVIDSLKEPFAQAKETTKEAIKVVAGPIISVDEETKRNPIFDLAEEEIVDLWISPFRQQTHYRVFGVRFVYKEGYHAPLAMERQGEYMFDRLVISKFIYDFENLIESLEMRKYQRGVRTETKTVNEIKALRKKLGVNYDFLISDEKYLRS
jgi:hypothetical protein